MIDTELAVAYINGRIQERVTKGQERTEAVLDTLAKLDEDLYVKLLKDGAQTYGEGPFTEYLRRYYNK